MSDKVFSSEEYTLWVRGLKQRFQQSQIKAATAVNRELILFYWELGREIVEKEKDAKWGSKFLDRLSGDLTHEFPHVKGFSKRNLELIRKWFLFWSAHSIAKQVVSQLSRVPWGHNLKIVSKCSSPDEALFYLHETIANHWSRSVLVLQIESGLYQRKGKAISNFDKTLPAPQSDLAKQTLKDPYMFDFLSLTDKAGERTLEKALVDRVSQFLLELGSGFAYVGKQVPLPVGNREFFLDLLFYHTRLHCYVVIELKIGEFEPEYAGKLNFYLKAVDERIKGEEDKQSIGILLCKSRDEVVAEYSLSDLQKPMGVASYYLTNQLPESLQKSFPSAESLEQALSDDNL